MNEYAQPAFDFEAREAMLQLRKQELARAVAEMVRSGQMPPPQGQMVSGRYVRPSWTEHLARVIKPVMQRQNVDAVQGVFEKEVGAYNAADRKAAQEHIASRPQGRPELAGPVDEANPAELQARSPTTQDLTAWAQKGTAIPSRKAVLTKLLEDLEVNAPIRKEASAEKVLDREAYGQRPARDRIKQFTDADGKQYLVNQDTGQVQELLDLEAALKNQSGAPFIPVKDAQGQIRILDKRTGNLGAPMGPIKSVTGASTKAAAASQQKIEDAHEVLGNLERAKELVSGATGSGLGADIDKGLKYFGMSSESADKAKALATIEGTLISKMPKMTGPQSDKDVALYKQMAGQIGDPTVPESQKRAAIAEIERINRRYSSGVSGSWDKPATSLPRPKSKAERDALPPGTRYIGPDGQPATR